MIGEAEESRCWPIEHEGELREIFFDPHFTDDVSALRHGEHMANSGWCGCSRDKALCQVPIKSKPTTVAEMLALVSGKGSCRELSCWEREVLSHTPVEGDDLPTPCFVEGCKYAHDPADEGARIRGLARQGGVTFTRHVQEGEGQIQHVGDDARVERADAAL